MQEQGLRLPQDVAAGDRRGVPALESLRGSVAFYAGEHDFSLRAGDFSGRARACWGLVARGEASLSWIDSGLRSTGEERLPDAIGVLRWIGPPLSWMPRLRDLADRLPDSEALDALTDLLLAVDGAPVDTTETPPVDGVLLGGAFDPFTERIWFVEAPFDVVAAETQNWLTDVGGRTFTDLTEPLPRMLSRLEPWAMGSWKTLVVATTGDWTAIFSQGSDIYIANAIGKRIGRRNLRTCYSPHVVRDGQIRRFGGRSLWLEDSGRSVRTIQASWQSRWDWDLRGEPQPFEDVTAYDAKRIPDRFTLHHLNAACRALGIARDDPDFYRPLGLLVEEDIRGRRRPRQMSSAEWRSEHR